MVRYVPKNYRCKNCGREQYSNEFCFGCQSKTEFEVLKTKETLELNDKLTEMKLEHIRVYLEKVFPNIESTRQSTLDFVVEHFFSKYLKEISEANN